MIDRLTDADLDAIEQRYPSTEAWEAGLIAMGTRARADVPALVAEVRRLRAELAEERLRVRVLQVSEADHARDRDTIERIVAALDGEQ